VAKGHGSFSLWVRVRYGSEFVTGPSSLRDHASVWSVSVPVQQRPCSSGRQRPLPPTSLAFATQLGLVLVAFAAGRFQVEHQVLHIESQLSERFLDKLQDLAAA